MLVNPTGREDHPDIRPTGQINNPVAQAAIWAFYEGNLDRVIIKVSFIKIRVKDLRIVFELIAGPEPQ